jgi:hypothetical protein
MITDIEASHSIIKAYFEGKLEKIWPSLHEMLKAFEIDMLGELNVGKDVNIDSMKEILEVMQSFLGPISEKYASEYNDWKEHQLFD